jgi:TolB-like protein/Flp pilus assembly protein TadD
MVRPGASDHPPPEAVREELDRILASAGFARNERLSRFLRFVVERHLEGRDGELKESVVGIEVLGRRPDFDPRVDSTVRSEAGRLRSRLVEYYAGDGRADAVRITLPKGGYVPQCEWPHAPTTAAESTPAKKSSSNLWVPMRVITAVLVLAGLGWWWQLRPSAPITIAVLPLQNLTRNAADEYFADGLTDELIRNLALIDGLAPRSRTSSFAFKGRPQPLREVGRQLQAEYVLEGSVLRSGDRLRVDVQLVRVRDDRPLWAGRFDREVADVVAIQDEISRGIVNSLRLSLGRGRRRYETSVEAYDSYLRARALELQRGLPGVSDSVSAFRAVIAKDSSFAPAYAALAEAHAARSQQFRFDMQWEVANMRAAAERAIELDPLLAEAHDALGIAFARDAQWERSEKSFIRAIELDPQASEAHLHYGLRLLFPLGRIDEALHQFGIAESLDPLAPEVHYQTVYALLAASRFDEAATHCDKLPADFWGTSECVGRVRLGQGKIEEAIQVLETAYRRGVTAGSEIRGYLGYAYARAGRRGDAEKLAAEMPPLNPFNAAVIFAGLGDKDRCLEALDRGATAGPYRIAWVLAFPEYRVLRGDPRVKDLRKKVGLPE